jgi:hypothetical protein
VSLEVIYALVLYPQQISSGTRQSRLDWIPAVPPS